MKKIKLDNSTYEIIKDNCNVDNEEIEKSYTDYYEDFDYIFGDYSYGKLRLKGYYESENKNAKNYNDIKDLDDYINNYCSFGAKYFLLKKTK